MCLKLRDVVIFVAGAEFFHTIAHVMMPYFMTLPVDMKFVVLTSTMNNYAIIGNAVVTVLLLWWASRLGMKCKVCEECVEVKEDKKHKKTK